MGLIIGTITLKSGKVRAGTWRGASPYVSDARSGHCTLRALQLSGVCWCEGCSEGLHAEDLQYFPLKISS